MTIELSYMYCTFNRVCLYCENQSGDFIEPVKLEELPLSEEMIIEGNRLISEYACLPENVSQTDKSHWSYKDRISFLEKSSLYYEKLKLELGAEFKILRSVYSAE